MTEKTERKENDPVVCPLLSIANPQVIGFQDCARAECWFYQRKMKLCAFVIMAMALMKLEAKTPMGPQMPLEPRPKTEKTTTP